MSPSTPHIVEQLTWEGAIGPPVAIALWVAFAVLAAWALRRERHAVGRGWGTAFWFLRCVAFAVALWMLAGPTRQLRHRTTTQQSVAIFADRSDSMDVIDPPDTPDSLRWAIAANNEAVDSPIARCDRLTVALGVALADCERFEKCLDEHRSSAERLASLEAINVAVKRALTHIDVLADLLQGDGALATRAERIASILRATLSDAITSNLKAVRASNHREDPDVAARHADVVHAISAARRRALVIAADVADQQTIDPSKQAASDQSTSRREKAVRTLDDLETQLRKREDGLRIKRYAFADLATPVSIDDGWSHALASLPAAADDGEQNETNSGSEELANSESAVAGPTTNLTSVFEQLSGGEHNDSTRLAVLVTDGRHNDAAAIPPYEMAAQLGNMPIFVVPIGNSVLKRDVLLHRVEAPSAVSEKDSALIDVIASGFDCDGQSTAVVLRHQGREIDRKSVKFTGTQSDSRVRFTVPAKSPGWQEYVVEVEPFDDEENTSNNFQPVSFEVVRDSIRGLLADSVARWEYRYLNQLFRRDEHVKFDELLFFPRRQGTGALAERPEFPQDVEGWARYDVVILGDLNPQQLPVASQRSLVEYVQVRGGEAVIIAGQNAMPGTFAGQPLMELLPVERANNLVPQQGRQLRLTEEGRLHSALLIEDSASDSLEAWRRTYERFPIYGLSEYSRPKETARTLIEAASELAGNVRAESGHERIENAFLCWQRVGAGRVAYLASPDTYRLRWRRGDRLHHRFWGQLLRWITAADTGAGSEMVRLQTDRTRYNTGEVVEVTAWLKDATGRPLVEEKLTAEATTFSDEVISASLIPDADVPGRYFGVFDSLSAGAYKIGVRSPTLDKLAKPGDTAQPPVATITVRGATGVEMLNTQCDRALLERVAQITGGQTIPPTAISEVFELVSLSPKISERIESTPLWNRWPSLVIVLGCLFTEWLVRKLKGLV